jgi:hypothetical protein
MPLPGCALQAGDSAADEVERSVDERHLVLVRLELVDTREGRDHGGGDHPRLQIVTELIFKRVGERFLNASAEIPVVRGERFGLADQLLLQVAAVLVENGVIDRREVDGANRIDHRLAGRAIVQARHRGLERLGKVGEDDVFLGRKVGKEGARGDLGRVGDLADGRVVEALLGEQIERGFDDRFAGSPLLPFAYRSPTCVAPTAPQSPS